MDCHKRSILLGLGLWLACGPLWAWAGPGHRLIAALAESRLELEVAERVRAMLDGESLAEVSNWADDLIDTATCSHTEPWHYINIADGETLLASQRSERGDLLAAIGRFERQLSDPHSTHEERQWALKYLIHLIGDVHQPLHIGRRQDRGGNDLEIEWFGETTNLHLVWDYFLIARAGVDDADLATFVAQRSSAELARWERASLLEWLNESLRYRQTPYEVSLPAQFGDAYVEKNLPLVRLCLSHAGVRLAAFLNNIFRHPFIQPPASSSLSDAGARSFPCAPERSAED